MSDGTGVETGGKTEAILNAAVLLFGQFGYRRTAMDDIAREAGVAKGTLYLYFDGKAAVFRAMQQRNFEDVERRCDQAEAAGGSFRERLLSLLEANYGWMHIRYGASEHLSELGVTRLTVGGDLAEAHGRAYLKRLTRLFETADDIGEITLAGHGLSTETLTETILAAARGAKQSAIGQPVSPEAYRMSLAHIAVLAAAAVNAKTESAHPGQATTTRPAQRKAPK